MKPTDNARPHVSAPKGLNFIMERSVRQWKYRVLLKEVGIQFPDGILLKRWVSAFCAEYDMVQYLAIARHIIHFLQVVQPLRG